MITRTGEGGLRHLEENWKVDFSRRIAWREGKEWQPVMWLGINYFENRPNTLIDDHLTYLLAAGVSWRDTLELTWRHNSTARRTHPNSGFDVIQLQLSMQF